ncbi:MAG TPA: DNA replication/repair protein RecF [Chloroflexota bacterium]|nr:DNA replication/repair protein RecF [Chloroflexota bacterium]
MWLNRLALANFRTYVRLGLELPQGVLVFHGANGQGKTNLLEAVYLLATTKSPRASSDRELINWLALDQPQPFARIAASLHRGAHELHIDLTLRAEVGLAANGANGLALSKQVRVGGLPQRVVEYVGTVIAVLFSPEDVGLVAGPPAGRRRYLDITLSQVNPRYLRALQRYTKIVAQRNHLLRQVRERRQPLALLEPWDTELVRSGTYIVEERARLLTALNSRLTELFRALSGGHARLEVAYRSSLEAALEAPVEGAPVRDTGAPWRSGPPPAPLPRLADLAERFAHCLTRGRERELAQGVSLVGPHRDDLVFLLDDVPLGTYGSRGQQRLAVLALKLAEVEFMRAETGERPLLLLDDILSELDPARQAFVLQTLGSDGQTFLTTTDLGGFDSGFLARARVYRIADGTIHAG